MENVVFKDLSGVEAAFVRHGEVGGDEVDAIGKVPGVGVGVVCLRWWW